LEKSEKRKKKFRKMLDKDQIDRIAAFAKAYPVISAIYLFGSHASGHERSRSDIDLGVLFNEDKVLYHDGTDFSFIFRTNSIRDYLDTNYLRRQRMAILHGQKHAGSPL
jgi:predicted nucleotidyltransferase